MQDETLQRLDQQPWLEALAAETQPLVQEAFKTLGARGQSLKNALNGVWLGHALHPVMTDIPIGAWTTAVAIDAAEIATGNTSIAPGADAALAVGLAGAVGAALTGLADWSDTEGRPRRLGAAHALLNVGATALMTGSLLLRRANRRPAARLLSVLGYGLTCASSWLGGHLVFGEQIGVDHTVDVTLPQHWVDVMAAEDLADQSMRHAVAEGTPVVLVRRGAHVFALLDHCAHLGAPLSEGKLEGEAIECPWHGSRFAVDDGRVLCGPSARPQRILQSRVRAGRIEVKA